MQGLTVLLATLLMARPGGGARLRTERSGVSPDNAWAGTSGYEDIRTRATAGGAKAAAKRDDAAAMDSGDAEEEAAAIAALVGQRAAAVHGCGVMPCSSMNDAQVMRSLGLKPGGSFSIRASSGYVFYKVDVKAGITEARAAPAVALADEELDTMVDPPSSVKHAFRFTRGQGSSSNAADAADGWCVESLHTPGVFWNCDTTGMLEMQQRQQQLKLPPGQSFDYAKHSKFYVGGESAGQARSKVDSYTAQGDKKNSKGRGKGRNRSRRTRTTKR